MGALGGHMNHLWEDLGVTFGELREIFSDAVSGDLECFEKADGINMFFTVDSRGNTRFARNSTEIKNGGLTQAKMAANYIGHDAETQFVEGIEAISQLTSKDYWPLGFSKKNWVNCDMIHKEHPQTLQYSECAIVIHNASAWKNGKKLRRVDLSRQFAQLAENFSRYSVPVNGLSWQGYGPIQIELEDLRGRGISTEAESAFNLIFESTGLDWDSTLEDFTFHSLMAGAVGDLDISHARKLQLVEAILGRENAIRLIDIKKGLTKEYAAKVSALGAKKNRFKVLGEALRPVERVITRFGARLLENVHSILVENPIEECDRLEDSCTAAILMVETADDEWSSLRQEILSVHKARLDSAGYYPPPMEGIVFNRGHDADGVPKQFKMTGTFAPVNQILGVTRYGRGAVPPVCSQKQMTSMAVEIAMIRGMSTIS